MNGKHTRERTSHPPLKYQRACGVHELLQSNVQAQAPSGPNHWDGELFKGKVKGTSEGGRAKHRAPLPSVIGTPKWECVQPLRRETQKKNGKTPKLKSQGAAVLTHLRRLSKDEAYLVLMGQLRNHSHLNL